MMIKTYSELIKLKTFIERFKYLKLDGTVGAETFGFDRYLNQRFYTSKEWISFRNKIILRDSGCDLGILDRGIFRGLVIHHLNPITAEQLINHDPILLDPENVITTQEDPTHKAIHYGSEDLLVADSFAVRRPNDTCLWKG